ncbi:MAG: hypothetical protein LBK62_05325 [Treponema sp.]|jgi:hypothetical protein|nr:hypothetical protein [Treponema sp.]
MKPLKEKGPLPAGMREREAYRKVTEALVRRRSGATVADITAATALPLSQIRELLPMAADEFSGRLEVTESGEIRYSFPRGFVSRYRGFNAALRRFSARLLTGLGKLAALAFKVWIMLMLIGYFVLFMAIAFASLFISVAVNSRDSSSSRSGGQYIGPGMFNLIWRLWFYSELTRSLDRHYEAGRRPGRENKRPLHRAIFSFVFGEEDPNKNWAAVEKKALIAYIQVHKGVISQPEVMALTGKDSVGAEQVIMACCAEFGGSPEATADGVLVYRFDELLLRADTRDRSFSGLSAPLQRLKRFSVNPKTMNVWFGLINTVNLFFGSYFLYNAFTAGVLATQEQFNAASYLYAVAYYLFSRVITPAPHLLIGLGLGLVPLAFSLFFWLIPALRLLWEKKENEQSKLRNLRRLGFSRIWEHPLEVESGDIKSDAPECRPRDLAAAQDRVIKEMAAWSVPDVEMNPRGTTVYSFKELEREKQALEKYRSDISGEQSSLGKTVFDSES